MKKHICTHCGEEFTGKKRKYCNDKCRYEYDKVRKRKQYRLDNNIKSRSCPICDKEFEPNRNGALTKYCSQDCADEARGLETGSAGKATRKKMLSMRMVESYLVSKNAHIQGFVMNAA